MVLNPLAQINFITIGVLAVIFLVTFFLLRWIFFFPVIEVMEKRAASIETARTKKGEAESLFSSAQLKAEEIFAEARTEAERIADVAKEEVIKMRGAKIAQANAEADAILSKGSDEVLALKQSEEAKLKEELWVCVNQTLTKMIGPVDEKKVRFMVNKVLAEKGIGRQEW
jgi:F0F1-type ATP synthase membrane subunit b/b'